jgi:16S rRNA U1498 N3-methylase RsmE
MIDAAARNASWSSSSSSHLFFLSKRCARRNVSSSTSSAASSPLSSQPGGVVKVECKNRILFTPDEFFDEKRRARLRASDARFDHLRTVLKKTREGETVKMTILNEGLAVGRIVTTGNDEDEDGVLIEVVVLEEEEKKKKEKNVKVSLLLAMPRPKVLRRLLSVFAQFGVENVYLFKAEKTERFYFQSDVLAEEMLVREFTRGVEQNAVDASFPNASKCRGLKQVLEELVLENENGNDDEDEDEKVDLAERVAVTGIAAEGEREGRKKKKDCAFARAPVERERVPYRRSSSKPKEKYE